MMKFLLSSLFIFSPFFMFGIEQDEIETIQELIDTTKKNLYSQQKLLKLILEFKQAKGAFVEDPTSGKLATTLVKSAMSLQKHLANEHLSHLFSIDFLTELNFFNQVGKRASCTVEK